MDQTNEQQNGQQSSPLVEEEAKPTTVPSFDQKVIDDAGSDSDASDPQMPPLEDITKELSAPPHNKNIKGVVTENGSEDEGDELEESKDGWIDILNNGDLRKKVLKAPKEGENEGRPPRGCKVILRLITRIYEPSTSLNISDSGDDNKPLVDTPTDIPTGPVIADESFDRFALVIGDNDLYQGLDLLLPLMDCGETARLLIKPRFAYGQPGNKTVGIPEDSTLDLEVELLEIIKYSDDPFGGSNPLSGGGEPEPGEPNPIVVAEPLEERIRFGNYKKTRGNFWFERGEYSLAVQGYRGAIRYLDASEEELSLVDRAKKDPTSEASDKVNQIEDLVDKRAQSYNNLAAAQLKLQNYESALRSVEDSLLLRPENVKALYRRAKIRTEKGDIEEAIEDLTKAGKIDTSSVAVSQELDRLNKIMARQLKEQRQMYRRMMQVKDDEVASSPSNVSSGSPKSDVASKKSNNNASATKSKDPKSQSPEKAASKWFSSTKTISAVGAVAAAVIIPTLYAYLK